MQILGRRCEACEKDVIAVEAADGCGSCDVVLCASCLEKTDRCPSCQRRFDDTRDAKPRIADRVGDALDRGRRQVIAVAVTLAGAIVVVALFGGAPIMAAIMQLVVLALLVFQLFRGRAWAKWILAALTAIAAFANAYNFVSEIGHPVSTFSLVLGILFLWSALVLAFSPPLRRFLSAQRVRHP